MVTNTYFGISKLGNFYRITAFPPLPLHLYSWGLVLWVRWVSQFGSNLNQVNQITHYGDIQHISFLIVVESQISHVWLVSAYVVLQHSDLSDMPAYDMPAEWQCQGCPLVPMFMSDLWKSSMGKLTHVPWIRANWVNFTSNPQWLVLQATPPAIHFTQGLSYSLAIRHWLWHCPP